MKTPSNHRVHYAAVRHKIRHADLLLFRARPRWHSLLIAAAGRSLYAHAALTAWWGDRLVCLETRQWVGGRAVALSNLVSAAPGRIDVYSLKLSEDQRAAAVDLMISATGRRYGWNALVWHAARNAPLVRWLLPPELDDGSNGSLPVCSQLVSRAYRDGAGIDLTPNLSDRATTPGDLARSALCKYRFTLEI
ncbi:MAG: hypothetical protein HUU20_17015 [Pirellulales bacterium]|nr:hypothetical protein [Pirellulales bacterium]